MSSLDVHDLEESLLSIKQVFAPPSRPNFFKIQWHIITSILVVAHIAAFMNYLRFKLYLFWRHQGELLKRPWLIPLLICEVTYFISSIISAVDLLLPPRCRPRIQPPLLQQFPSVDIFLPCCKEPTDVAEDSIRAAMALDYPNDRFRVFVLDDGGDDDLKAFCEALVFSADNPTVKYLRRVKVPGVPHNFKCGNLNYGLEHSDAEYVVMMDADMILHPSFLQVMLPHILSDPEVAFVQIPQSYYNLPVGDPLNDASVFWYERVMYHRDSLGMAPCVGTGAVFRRKHIDEIGGFQPMSITEDTMTAFVLFNRGYKSVFLNRKLQAGLTPWTFEGYIKQRRRWCVGAMQQFSATWKGMLGTKSKLSFPLKTCYFWHTGYYFLSVVTIVMVIIFVCSLAFQLELVVGTSDDTRQLITYLAMFLVLWRLSYIAVWISIPQSIQSRNRDESHHWWMTPFFFKTIWQSIFSYKSTFTFTPTSNIDRVAAENMLKQSYFAKLHHVKAHVLYVFLVLPLVIWRIIWIVLDHGKRCNREFFIIAISLSLLSTCAHMLIPIMYVIFQPNSKPADRKSLLRYKEGIPQFSEDDYFPKWHWSTIFYEAISSYIFMGFWVIVLATIPTKRDQNWCKGGVI